MGVEVFQQPALPPGVAPPWGCVDNHLSPAGAANPSLARGIDRLCDDAVHAHVGSAIPPDPELP